MFLIGRDKVSESILDFLQLPKFDIQIEHKNITSSKNILKPKPTNKILLQKIIPKLRYEYEIIVNGKSRTQTVKNQMIDSRNRYNIDLKIYNESFI